MDRIPCSLVRGVGSILVPLVFLACRSGEPERGPEPGDPGAGFRRAHELGCASCHPGAGLTAEPAPRLERVGERLTPTALARALQPGPRMPDCLGGLGPAEGAAARDELVHFLASLGGPLVPEAAAFDVLTIERGRQLFHALGCVACHAPFEPAETLARALWEFPESFEPASAPRRPASREPRELAGIGARTSHAALAAYLEDPLARHPSGRMPSLDLGPGEAADLAAYLLYEDAVERGAFLAPGPGLLVEHYEGDFAGELPGFEALTPVRSEVATSFFDGLQHRADDFGFRFQGLLAIETPGRYRFWTRSDDGSMLRIGSKLVVDNRGQHALDERSGELHLEAGRHAFELEYFEHQGDEGLLVDWSGPDFARRPLGFEVLSHLEVRLPPPATEPFALDEALVERGRERYEELGCAQCHTRCGEDARPFGELDPRRGCLARTPAGRAPRYALTERERADLAAAIRAGTPPAEEPEVRLAAVLERLECGACHARGALTGPDDERRRYFQVEGGLDLGDEGRLPPTLERVGAKLKPAWLDEVLTAGGRVRPYMRTRMPQFGEANVGELAELFAQADAATRDEREPPFSAAAVEAGKALAGTQGLGCIQCHELAGHPSIGIPAVDLATVHARLWPGWFRELLMDPVALKMNTRMPAFWVDGKSPVKDVLGGDPAAQVEALWTYLSLGSSMPLPTGLVPLEGEYEVEVYERPVCVGVFMDGVGPRTVCVGLPERVHYAFDVERSRLALAWRGRFLDARGTWYARAGQLERPAGEDVLEFPPGPAVALLERAEDPWPAAAETVLRPLGRGLDAGGRPVFRYRLGGVSVAETLAPELRVGGAVLVRRLELSFAEPDPGPVDLRLALGREIVAQDEALVVSGTRELRLRLAPEGARLGAHVTGPEGARELRVRVRPTREARRLEIEVEYAW